MVTVVALPGRNPPPLGNPPAGGTKDTVVALAEIANRARIATATRVFITPSLGRVISAIPGGEEEHNCIARMYPEPNRHNCTIGLAPPVRRSPAHIRRECPPL